MNGPKILYGSQKLARDRASTKEKFKSGGSNKAASTSDTSLSQLARNTTGRVRSGGQRGRRTADMATRRAGWLAHMNTVYLNQPAVFFFT